MKTRKLALLFSQPLMIMGGLLLFSATSCVSMQTYRDTQARALRSEYNAANLQAEIDHLREQRVALEAQMNHAEVGEMPSEASSAGVEWVTE